MEQIYESTRSGKIIPKEKIVRCKDCKYWSAERINDFNKCRRWINVGVKNFATMGDWFCADGERETVDQKNKAIFPEEAEKRKMLQDNWKAQMNMLGYDESGNPLP